MTTSPSEKAEVGSGRRLQTLLLLGGNEWRPDSVAADSWWLARAARPEVTVLTSAAQDIPETAVGWAAAYFRQLGASVQGCFIQTGKDAADPRRLAQLSGAAAIYLCGGDPAAAQTVLYASPAAEQLRLAFRAGVPLAGSSAGAMVLGGGCLAPSQDFAVRPGLGLVPGVLVVPHWNSASSNWRRAAAGLAQEYQVVAVDESTGVCWDGRSWTVRGPGRAVLVTGSGEVQLGSGRPSPPVE
jgi:cyanophycinase